MESEILAKVIRGETVESIHRGHLIVLDGDGRTIFSRGNHETVTFYRSACKPLQAIPLVTSGAADAFGFTDEEIALASASHSGEPAHVEIVTRMLAKIGLSESDLRCGVHLPFNEKEAERILRGNGSATQLHNNCSGKHAGMLALAKHIGADVQSYENADNAVQKLILETVSTFAGIPVNEIRTGIDGCSVPNFAVPLAAMARSFVNLCSPPEHFDENLHGACGRVVTAMITSPELIGGTERLDTMLMQAAPGKIISKVGADGVWLCGILPSEKWPSGLGIALKIEDGDDKRARPVVSVEILRQLRVFNTNDLIEISPMLIKNRRGDVAGRVESVFLSAY